LVQKSYNENVIEKEIQEPKRKAQVEITFKKDLIIIPEIYWKNNKLN
jgi:hypothetical protein